MHMRISMRECLCVYRHTYTHKYHLLFLLLCCMSNNINLSKQTTQLKYSPPLLVCSTLFFVSNNSMLTLWCSALAWASSSPWLLHRCCSITYCPLSSSQLSTAHLNYNTCGQHIFIVQYYTLSITVHIHTYFSGM